MLLGVQNMSSIEDKQPCSKGKFNSVHMQKVLNLYWMKIEDHIKHNWRLESFVQKHVAHFATNSNIHVDPIASEFRESKM